MKPIHKLRSTLALLLSISAGTCIASPNSALPKADVEALIVGNTLEGHHLRKGFEFLLFVKPDGSITEKLKGAVFGKGIILAGEWHIDSRGAFCWRYSHKPKRRCRWIKKNGNGTYTEIKRNGKGGRQFRMLSGNALSKVKLLGPYAVTSSPRLGLPG